MAHTLPDLPYAIDALAPYMSQETLEFHHGKHHQTYVTNLNNLTKEGEFANANLEDIVKKTYNKADKAGVFNNSSQHWNHILFWKCMKPNGGGPIPGELEKRLKDSFGSGDEFKSLLRRPEGAARLRCVGAQLLHRLPQPPPGLPQGIPGQHGKLGVRGQAALGSAIRYDPSDDESWYLARGPSFFQFYSSGIN